MEAQRQDEIDGRAKAFHATGDPDVWRMSPQDIATKVRGTAASGESPEFANAFGPDSQGNTSPWWRHTFREPTVTGQGGGVVTPGMQQQLPAANSAQASPAPQAGETRPAPQAGETRPTPQAGQTRLTPDGRTETLMPSQSGGRWVQSLPPGTAPNSRKPGSDPVTGTNSPAVQTLLDQASDNGRAQAAARAAAGTGQTVQTPYGPVSSRTARPSEGGENVMRPMVPGADRTTGPKYLTPEENRLTAVKDKYPQIGEAGTKENRSFADAYNAAKRLQGPNPDGTNASDFDPMALADKTMAGLRGQQAQTGQPAPQPQQPPSSVSPQQESPSTPPNGEAPSSASPSAATPTGAQPPTVGAAYAKSAADAGGAANAVGSAVGAIDIGNSPGAPRGGGDAGGPAGPASDAAPGANGVTMPMQQGSWGAAMPAAPAPAPKRKPDDSSANTDVNPNPGN